jgi:hypothetical protein
MTGVVASWLRVVGPEGDFEWLLSELRRGIRKRKPSPWVCTSGLHPA